MRRLNKVKIKWSPNFAYAIGLITTDGNLSPDNRHLNMTSKDKKLIISFKKCLGIKNKIGKKTREYSKEKKYFVVQFGDINFYNFLMSIGLTPAKSKILSKINIPKKYFADFLRGCIDGDGNISISYHPESNQPQLKIRLASGSLNFLEWVDNEIYKHIKTTGGWISDDKSVFVLNYAKKDSIKLLNFMYYNGDYEYLERKYKIGKEFLYK
ncbi:MAG: LAGLIDADG family homing endonuclease [Candidatus Paceibacterota bacterium]